MDELMDHYRLRGFFTRMARSEPSYGSTYSKMFIRSNSKGNPRIKSQVSQFPACPSKKEMDLHRIRIRHSLKGSYAQPSNKASLCLHTASSLGDKYLALDTGYFVPSLGPGDHHTQFVPVVIPSPRAWTWGRGVECSCEADVHSTFLYANNTRCTFRRWKKSAGPKSVASDGEDRVEGLDTADPSTLMSGVQTPTEDGKGKKKGKKKKKKLSKSEKAHEKLEKAIGKLKENEAYFDNFIDRMHRWLMEKAPTAIELFKKMDVDGEGAVTTEEFKSGLFEMQVPLSAIEMHLLTRLLDQDDTGEVDYTLLGHGLQLARETFDLGKDEEFERIIIPTTKRKFPPCPCCKMSYLEPPGEELPRYIALELRMVTFDNFRDYPGHLDLIVHAHLPVCGLIAMVVEETQITSSKIAIFRDRTRSRESLLPPKCTLHDCGYFGDSRMSPEEVLLYYDYTVEFTDCPLLLCDHYFGQKEQMQILHK